MVAQERPFAAYAVNVNLNPIVSGAYLGNPVWNASNLPGSIIAIAFVPCDDVTVTFETTSVVRTRIAITPLMVWLMKSSSKMRGSSGAGEPCTLGTT